MTNDFSTSAFFSRIMRFWWILVGLMILGGMTALMMTLLLKPVYESKAIITSTLDYSVLGKLDDWEEDQVYLAIGDIIDSTSVKTDVISLAASNGQQISADFIEKSFSVDRQDTRWVMRVRTDDPALSYKLAGYWSTASVQALYEMEKQNSSSMVLQQNLNALAACFSQTVVQDPVSASCSVQNLSAIREEISKLEANISVQDPRSSLILSHVSFELTTEPILSTSAVLFSRNFLVLTGALIGLCIGLMLFSLNWPKIK